MKRAYTEIQPASKRQRTTRMEVYVGPATRVFVQTCTRRSKPKPRTSPYPAPSLSEDRPQARKKRQLEMSSRQEALDDAVGGLPGDPMYRAE